MSKKNSLIIGGSKGIGSIISKYLRKRGDKIYTISRNSSENKKNIKLDLSNNKSIKYSLRAKLKNIKIDNIIFSQRYRGSNEIDQYNTDLFSTINILLSLKDNLKKNASVVLLASVSNKTIVDDQNLNYHIIRSAIEQLMRYYAVKFSSKQIRFNCILPSKILKPSNKKFFYKSKKGIKIRKHLELVTPLKRMGKAEDIANLVLFLTDKMSEYITGQSFIIDGGLSLVSQESVLNIIKKK